MASDPAETADEARRQHIDDKIEEMAAAKAAAQGEAEDELARRRKLTDSKGKQLKFEGLDVEKLESRFKGTVRMPNLGHLNLGTKVRFEGEAVVTVVKNELDDGSVERLQVLSPLHVEILKD